MSMTPAFSPGPWITHGAWVGRVFKWIFEDLYEQCSFHMAEKMPSSVKLGARPMSAMMRWYSSGLSPCSATRSGVMSGSLGIMREVLEDSPETWEASLASEGHDGRQSPCNGQARKPGPPGRR